MDQEDMHFRDPDNLSDITSISSTIFMVEIRRCRPDIVHWTQFYSSKTRNKEHLKAILGMVSSRIRIRSLKLRFRALLCGDLQTRDRICDLQLEKVERKHH